ncbi:MAG: phosphatase PAP2 family protein [Cyanobacteria bacterium P01_G01_bin.49]
MIRYFVNVWKRYINPHLFSLIATVGVGGLVLCLLLSFLIVQLSEEVLEKEAFAFDKSFLLWLYQFANPTLDQIMISITQLGNTDVVIIVAVITFSLLWRKHYHQEAKLFLLACLGTLIISTGMKVFFAKPRPQLWTHLITTSSFSFPSGHALVSIVLYGFIAYLVSSHYPKFSRLIYYFAAIIISLIGLSRLYLGVHWPTDIIAGYSVGFLWLMFCIVLLKLQNINRNS